MSAPHETNLASGRPDVVARAVSISQRSIVLNLLLAAGKIVAGVTGHTYALVADGIESCADALSSFIVWAGLRIAAQPPDANHPYGHGKAESIAAVVVSFLVLGAAVTIAVQSIQEIRRPHQLPAPFTLLVLIAVILIKLYMARRVGSIASQIQSAALRGDALHHYADVATSIAAFIGISIGLLAGPGYEAADDWAALLACGVVTWHGLGSLKQALSEMMDESPSQPILDGISEIARTVPGVCSVEKCRLRKLGLYYALDLHVRVPHDLTVLAGHDISHKVKDKLLESPYRIRDVVIHIEPDTVPADDIR